MTQREIIYSIKRIIRAGRLVDDDKITDRQIAFLADSVRSVLLRQQYDKGQSLSDNHIQYISCLSVEQVDTAFDIDVPSDCKVYRTILELPQPVESKSKDLITRISANEFRSMSIDFVPYNRLPFVEFTRFHSVIATRYRNRIYIINAPYFEKLTIGGVWDKPNDLSNYTDCSGTACFTWDSKYPLSSHLIDPLIKMVVEELTLSLKVNTDMTNDSADRQESQLKQ